MPENEIGHSVPISVLKQVPTPNGSSVVNSQLRSSCTGVNKGAYIYVVEIA